MRAPVPVPAPCLAGACGSSRRPPAPPRTAGSTPASRRCDPGGGAGPDSGMRRGSRRRSPNGGCRALCTDPSPPSSPNRSDHAARRSRTGRPARSDLGPGRGSGFWPGVVGTVVAPGGTVSVPGAVWVPVRSGRAARSGSRAGRCWCRGTSRLRRRRRRARAAVAGGVARLSPGWLGARSQCVILPSWMMKFTRAVVPAAAAGCAAAWPGAVGQLEQRVDVRPVLRRREVLGAARQQPVDELGRREAVEHKFVPRAVEEHARDLEVLGGGPHVPGPQRGRPPLDHVDRLVERARLRVCLHVRAARSVPRNRLPPTPP